MRSHRQSPAPFSAMPARQLDHLVDQLALGERAEGRGEHRLLDLALGMAEAREQRLAVEHHRGVRGEDEIRRAFERRTVSTIAPASSSAACSAIHCCAARACSAVPSSAHFAGSIQGLML